MVTDAEQLERFRVALQHVATYADRQAEHYEHDGFGEARAWRHVQATAGRALDGHVDDAGAGPEELWALLHTVRRRLRERVRVDVLEAWLDRELDALEGRAGRR